MIIPFHENRDFERWGLLCSDAHLDNPKSKLGLKRAHLAEAAERNAFIIETGDTLDLMGGKFDKRSSKESIRPEHMVDNYFDAVIDWAADFYAPYARQIAIMGDGNHETAAQRHHEFSPTDRLVTLLRLRGGNIQKAGYGGFVVFTFQPIRKGKVTRDCTTRVTLRFQHGGGVGGPVTKGMIAAQRRAAIYRDADIVMAGHIHEEFITPFVQVGVNRDFTVYQKTQWHVQLPTYKDEWEDGHGGYHIERERGPRPVGAVWVRFYWCRREQRVKFDLIPAQ